jgi:hypothetical protein
MAAATAAAKQAFIASSFLSPISNFGPTCSGRINRSVRSWRHRSSLSQCLSFGKHSLDFLLANRDHHSAAYKPLWRVCCDASTSTVAPATEDALSSQSSVRDVLGALSTIIDPDFGTDIVSCGFVKDLSIDNDSSQVSFRLELTTPACPVKDMVISDSLKPKFLLSFPWYVYTPNGSRQILNYLTNL